MTFMCSNMHVNVSSNSVGARHETGYSAGLMDVLGIMFFFSELCYFHLMLF